MLFDLRGRRRRAVQATYLTLAAADGRRSRVLRDRRRRVGRALRRVQRQPQRHRERQRAARAAHRATARSAWPPRPQNERCWPRWCATTTRWPRPACPSGVSQYPEEAKDELRQSGRLLAALRGGADDRARRLAGPPGAQALRPGRAQPAGGGAEGHAHRRRAPEHVRGLPGCWCSARRPRATRERPTWPARRRSISRRKDLRKQVEKQVEQLKKPAGSGADNRSG